MINVLGSFWIDSTLVTGWLAWQREQYHELSLANCSLHDKIGYHGDCDNTDCTFVKMFEDNLVILTLDPTAFPWKHDW